MEANQNRNALLSAIRTASIAVAAAAKIWHEANERSWATETPDPKLCKRAAVAYTDLVLARAELVSAEFAAMRRAE